MRRLFWTGVFVAGMRIVAGAGDAPGAEARMEPWAPADAAAPALGTAFSGAAAPLWSAGDGEVKMRGWAWETELGLAVRVEVAEPAHTNSFRGGNLWRGDCVYVALDGLGDGDSGPGAGFALGEDDLLVVAGLGADGPEARVAEHGDPDFAGALPAECVKTVARDRKKGLTVYEVVAPWRLMARKPGAGGTVRLAALAAQAGDQKPDVPWGTIRGRDGKPREMAGFRLAQGGEPRVLPARTRLVGEAGETRIVVAAPEGAEVAAGWDHGELRGRVAPGTCGVALSIPARLVRGDRVVVSVGGLREEIALRSPAIAAGRLAAWVEDALGKADGAERRHWEVVRRLVARGVEDLAEAGDLAERSAVLAAVETILRLAPETVGTRRERHMPLVDAILSEADRTLQWYALQWPVDYDPGKAWPLVVYLHGAGPDNPVVGLATAFDNRGQDTLFTSEPKTGKARDPLHGAFVLAPWARGNSMYEGLAEEDVFQILEKVRKEANIDPDRIYLAGFSMGGNGVATLANHRPDLWAGLAFAGTCGPWAATGIPRYVEQWGGLPAYLWSGALDERMVPGTRALHARLRALGVPCELRIVENVPHTFPHAEFRRVCGWLFQHRRRVSGEWSYASDDRRWPGIRGVYLGMARAAVDGPVPRYRCAFGTGVLEITSENVPGLVVAPEKLGAEGELSIRWNGTEAWRGPATNETVRVGEPEAVWWMR